MRSAGTGLTVTRGTEVGVGEKMRRKRRDKETSGGKEDVDTPTDVPGSSNH